MHMMLLAARLSVLSAAVQSMLKVGQSIRWPGAQALGERLVLHEDFAAGFSCRAMHWLQGLARGYVLLSEFSVQFFCFC